MLILDARKFVAVKPMSKTGEPAAPVSVANALCGLRILVIEDIWIVAQSYVSLLDNLGVIVSGPAGTIAEAMALIEAVPVDVALVDMNLHGVMAYGVVEALSARGVPVVVVTGYDVVPELEHKVSAFLRKPLRAEALIKVMRGIAAAPRWPGRLIPRR